MVVAGIIIGFMVGSAIFTPRVNSSQEETYYIITTPVSQYKVDKYSAWNSSCILFENKKVCGTYIIEKHTDGKKI